MCFTDGVVSLYDDLGTGATKTKPSAMITHLHASIIVIGVMLSCTADAWISANEEAAFS